MEYLSSFIVEKLKDVSIEDLLDFLSEKLVKNKIKIDRHLQEFVLETPTSISKLIEVFDDLSIESQIKILDFLEEAGIPEKIIDKALLSKNPFIRYKAAKNVSLNEPNIKTIEKINADESLLVRYAPFESEYAFKVNPDDFFEFPFEKCLAYLRSNNSLSGENFSKIIDFGFENHKISEDILFDFVSEYLENPTMIYQFDPCDPSDGFSNYDQWNNFTALWKLATRLPVCLGSIKLVEKLPFRCNSAFASEDNGEVPLNILESLDNKLTEKLLWRKDVVLLKFRKKVFFSKKSDSGLTAAATSYHFNLTHQDFLGFIQGNFDKGKIEELIWAENISIIYFHAIVDIMDSREDIFLYDESFIEETRDKLDEEKLFAIYPKHIVEKQLFELAVYQMAKSIIPWDEKKVYIDRLSEEYIFLEKKIKPGDTWGTFIEFFKELKKQHFENILYQHYSSELGIASSDPCEPFVKHDKKYNFIENKIDYIGKTIIEINEKLNDITEMVSDR